MIFADKLISFLIYEEINECSEKQEDSREYMQNFYDLIHPRLTPWATIKGVRL
jgi:hypothetical protein